MPNFKTKKVLVEILIFLIKIIGLLKKFLKYFIILLFKPVYTVLRFIFYKIIVKGYCKYLRII